MTTSVRQRDQRLRYEREVNESATKAAAAELAKTAGALIAAQNKQVHEFWSRPIRELVSAEFNEAGVDDSLNLPTGDGTHDAAKVRAAMKRFIEFMTAKGFTLSADGRARLLSFVGFQYRGKNSDPHNLKTFIDSFDRLYQLECFGDEIGFDPSLVKEQPAAPAPAPTPENLSDIDLETVPVTGSREVEARAKKIVHEQYVTSFIGPIVGEWIQSLKSEPWNVVLTESQWLTVVRNLEALFTKQNLPVVAKSFDLARRIFTKSGILPEGLLLADEVLSDRLELSKLQNNRAARLEFVEESRKLRGLGV